MSREPALRHELTSGPMRPSMRAFRRALFVVGLGMSLVPAASRADRDGVEYVADSDTLIYGGMRYARRSGDSDDAFTVHVRRQGDGSPRLLLRKSGGLGEIKASPRGDLVGVLERIWNENVGKENATYVSRQYRNGGLIEQYLREESLLHVLTLDGEVRASLAGVRRYAWSPSGDRIAYITGTYDENEAGFETSGTWLYDLESGRSTRIVPGGYDVAWAPFDENIYIDDRGADSRVVRYEPATGELRDTSHRGIHFSPDGRYYYGREFGASHVPVFERTSDREVPLDMAGMVQMGQLNNASGWYDASTLVLSSAAPGELGDYLYDVHTGNVWQANGRVFPRGSRGADSVAVLVGTSSVVQTEKRALTAIRVAF